ncbi:hypothetical protein L226DRAFT_539191 [Lentinus tigrinus ALCF2SS1-7]|nr:hypothetical protein L226DRAFT_539191 [Lentinus tigrinus ALCF2SS1-7]
MAENDARIIVLPDLNYGVRLPPKITTPVPSATDVVAADIFRRSVVQNAGMALAESEAVAAAIHYDVRVSGAAAEPPWAGPMFQRLEDRLMAKLTEKIDQLEERVGGKFDRLEEKVDRLELAVQEVHGMAAKTHSLVGEVQQ